MMLCGVAVGMLLEGVGGLRARLASQAPLLVEPAFTPQGVYFQPEGSHMLKVAHSSSVHSLHTHRTLTAHSLHTLCSHAAYLLAHSLAHSRAHSFADYQNGWCGVYNQYTRYQWLHTVLTTCLSPCLCVFMTALALALSMGISLCVFAPQACARLVRCSNPPDKRAYSNDVGV